MCSYICYNTITERLLRHHTMEHNNENIDYKNAYHEQVSINEKLVLKQQDLAFQLAQLQKLVFGSRHEKFVAVDTPLAPTLFDIPVIPVLLAPITVSYEKSGKQSRPNHPGRNSFPENLRRVETVVNPTGLDLALVKKIGESVTETLAYVPAELFVKKVIRPKYLDAATNSIHQALAPERCFERSNVDPSLVAQIIVEKFVDHSVLWMSIVFGKTILSAVLKMREGPSKSAYRSCFQTTLCCIG